METYFGYVRTPADAIKLFEACRLGLLQRVRRRLSEKERQKIKSGSVFVWDEREAGMRRWTDGKNWSPSRVSGSFLTYREMDGKRAGQSSNSPLLRQIDIASPESVLTGDEDVDEESPDEYRYKPDGLMKQTFSITTSSGQNLHLISYYSRSDPNIMELSQPTLDPQLRHIIPPKGIYPETSIHEVQDTTATCPTIQSAFYPTPQMANRTPPQNFEGPNLRQYSHSPSYIWPSSPILTPSPQNCSLSASTPPYLNSSYSSISQKQSVTPLRPLSPLHHQMSNLRSYDRSSSSSSLSSSMNITSLPAPLSMHISGQTSSPIRPPLPSLFDKPTLLSFLDPRSNGKVTFPPHTSPGAHHQPLHRLSPPLSGLTENVGRFLPSFDHSMSGSDPNNNISPGIIPPISSLVYETELMYGDDTSNHPPRDLTSPSEPWKRTSSSSSTWQHLDRRDILPGRPLVKLDDEDQRVIRVLDRKFCC